jgi:anti-sigma factor RsiW
MSCQEVVKLLTDYLDYELSAEDAARLEAHLHVCDACAEYVAQFEATIALLRNTAGVPETYGP